MLKLEEMIDVPEGREIKRAIAVKMIILGFKTQDICDVLDVSDSFVSKWKTIYENEGAGGLRLRYKGGAGFLTESQRNQILRDVRLFRRSVPQTGGLTDRATGSRKCTRYAPKPFVPSGSSSANDPALGFFPNETALLIGQ
jgi:hypothetical protein